MLSEVVFLKCKYDGAVKRERTGDLLGTFGEWVVIRHKPGVHRHLKYGEPFFGGTYGAELFYLNTQLPITAMVLGDQLGAVRGH